MRTKLLERYDVTHPCGKKVVLTEQSNNPAGLINLGQTCYLNSSLQVLRAMPELKGALAS